MASDPVLRRLNIIIALLLGILAILLRSLLPTLVFLGTVVPVLVVGGAIVWALLRPHR